MNWRIGMPSRPAPKAQPSRAQPTIYRARRRYDAPASAQRYLDDAALGLIMPEIKVAAVIPQDESQTRIGIVGDSLAEALAIGIEADPGLRLDYAIRRKTVSSSGLVRDDYHDWPKTLRAFLAENRGMAAVIVMVGLNDRQVMRIGAESHEALSDAWRLAYRARIDAMIAAADEARIPLIWVGLPVMRLPRLGQDLMAINDMVRERVLASRHLFVETADAFADAGGGFSMTGPDIIGDIVRLRASDGIHFTAAGQRKLAFFVERPLRRIIGERSAPVPAAPREPEPAMAIVPAPLLAPASEPPAAAPEPSGDFAILIEPPAQLSPSLAFPRPEVGEIRPLNAPVLARQLVGAEPRRLTDDASRALFERGLAPEPRRGRADDFSWR